MTPDPPMHAHPALPHAAVHGMHAALQPGELLVYRGGASDRAAHDHATCVAIARRIADLKGFHFAGNYDADAPVGAARYYVPTNTLIGGEVARMLGIDDEDDLFGGVAPHAFVATKSISHRLVDDLARIPDGWSNAFVDAVEAVVLRGFAAFDIDDAARAGLSLLEHGPVRIKRSLGIGGFGQAVVKNRRELERTLEDADAGEVIVWGIVLEQDLADVVTYSVGQVRIDELIATYCGVQRLTDNNAGHRVYGGSELRVARGDFDALLALDHAPDARRAIEQARLYDAAAFRCFDGLFASRRNYDVAHGVDASGRACSGVLEQSWRIGGASGAEVEALIAFRRDPSLSVVRASTTEIYGSEAAVPPGATVYFQGNDDHAGPLTKYAMIDADP